MLNIRESLKGYKTYLIAAVGVLSAVLAYTNGASLFESINAVLGFLGLGTLRAGIKTDTGVA